MKRLFIFIVLLVLVSGCTQQADQGPGTSIEKGTEDLGLSLPESRSFHMGMTPWLYDYTQEAFTWTYDLIATHGDIVVHHFDGGVPWPEALAGGGYHQKAKQDLDLRVSQLKSGQKVYVALTPISFMRDDLAAYWGESNNMERPGEWANKEFDDPDVITAYTSFCRHMIQRFNPDYFAYGVEVNILATKDPEAFDKFMVLAEQVYDTLKGENPDMPVFLTLYIENFVSDEAVQTQAIEKLLPFTDYIAVSTYPFLAEENPDDLARDWFSRMRDLAPGKPFAIAETAFIAEDLLIESYGISKEGKAEWQSAYTRFLLAEADRLDAEFVAWFFPRDYDAAVNALEEAGVDELFKIWVDAGLVDESGKARESLHAWDAWLALPLR